MDTIQILEKLVSFNTIEDKENKEILDFIQKLLESNKYNCKRILDKNTNKECLIAQIGDAPILGFSGHLDTVGIANGWESDPLKIKIEDGYVYGLGVCDMKGGIAAFLKACTDIKKEDLRQGLVLIFTYDEEIGFDGINLLLKENIQFPKNVILAEPTDLKPVIATKGCLEIKVDFNGKSTHSSTPDKGKNAILEACKFINEITEFAEKLKKERNQLFSVPYTTMNIGKIQGGDATNKVPDKCTIAFDARTIDKKHNELIIETVNNLSKKYDCNYEIVINIASNINKDEDMISYIEKLCDEKRTTENYVTEASFLENTNSIIIGPGPVTAHQANECIELSKLNRLVEVYRKIIRKYCC